MRSRLNKHIRRLPSFLAMSALACGCQSAHYDSASVAVLGECAGHSTQETARGEVTPDTASAGSQSVVPVVEHDVVSESVDAGRSGEPSCQPCRFALASYRDPEGSDLLASTGWSFATNSHLITSGGSSLALSHSALQDQPSEAAESQQGGESLEEINNKLNNPGADLASLNFKFTWNQFKGDLGGGTGLRLTGTGLRRSERKPGQLIRNLLAFKRSSRGEGASSQNSLAMNFQPVFPFKLDDQGSNLMIRPSIPVVWQPSYNASNDGFDESFGIGDSQLVMFYANTNKETGFFWGAGPTMQFPTHTDDVLGNDAFMIGPAAYAGVMGKWGVVGAFPQHWWNIGGGDGYTSFTATQLFYWFSVGGGYQIGGAPIITYDWAADDSDNAWTIPVNLGVAKTIMIGKLPVKLKFEGIYYAEHADAFGPHWGLQFTMTPVIPNPFTKDGA
jgi:hypothetical protein